MMAASPPPIPAMGSLAADIELLASVLAVPTAVPKTRDLVLLASACSRIGALVQVTPG